MQMSFISIFMMLFAGGGAGNDLLDTIPSDAFWKAAGIEMSVAALSEELAKPAGENKKSDSVRRQMALRALGELKDEAAVAAIQPYLKSRDPFLADYAKAAMAGIKGEPYLRPTTSKDDRRTDLTSLPSGLGAIGGMSLQPGKPMDLAAELKKVDMPGKPEEIGEQLVAGLGQVSSQLGNLRVNSVTFGIAGDIGNDDGFVVFLVRGLYDSKALGKMIRQQVGGGTVKAGGLTYLEVESDNVYLAPVSDELLVFAAGPSRDQIPLAEVGEKIVGGGGDFTIGKALAQLLDKADTSAPLWVLAEVTPAYALAPFFAPFDTLQLTSEPAVDGKGGIVIQANGTDAEGAAVAVKMVNDGLDEMRESMAEGPGMDMVPAPFKKMLASINVAGDGKGAATMKAELDSAGAAAIMPLMMFGTAGVAAPAELEGVEEVVPEPAPVPE